MAEVRIRDKCRAKNGGDKDGFVGIRCEGGDLSIHFPLGFPISSEDKELRRDILLLIGTIGTAAAKKDSEIPDMTREYLDTMFPMQAYMAVIYDFYARGYYRENEKIRAVAKRGKIDWNKTIKTRQAYVQDGNVFYLDFVTKQNASAENELVTLIHEYCVYESFSKIGWLFTAKLPERPKLKYHEKLFRRVLKEKLKETFNDRDRGLFRNMLAIVDYQGNRESSEYFIYGTYRFEYVWETLIDKVYGISGKKDYFPKTEWIMEGESRGNAYLEPDTIMIYKGDIYILDAKYYKYGVTKDLHDLPDSSSVGKQITYGEYVAEQEKFRRIHGNSYNVYNAFLMPFDAMDEKWKSGNSILKVGKAVSDWKRDRMCSKTYEEVQGVLVDVKSLMKVSVRQDQTEIAKLAECISRGIMGQGIIKEL